MSLAAFDTLKLARTLRDTAHFPPEQAEGLAAALAETVQDGLPTKSEMNAEFAAVRGEIVSLRSEMKTEFAAVRSEIKLLEQRMTIKLGAMLFALAGIIIAAVRYLPAAH
ncbi:hypothetical protein [Methylobacterium sp. ID0610]|uniref:hypothetical protein n=1 Tax=Methylobacterium carpenticola TaxID=3344827 RepID=UPI0036CAD6B3